MNRLKLFFTYLLCCIQFMGYTQQESHTLDKIIPPSPTAAALGAYGDIPVSYHTGTPNISIPIYEIKSRGFSLPISFSYNASSVRVVQDASWVGLGWSLNAGGVITRSIRGLDDLDPIKGYYYAPTLPPNDVENNYSGDRGNTIDYYRLANDEQYRAYMHENWEEFYPDDHNYFMEINLGYVDAEPDIYYYNFGNYTGSFVMGKLVDGSPIIMSEKNNLKFEYTPVGNLNLGKWTVTDPDGTRYYFNTTELTEGYVSHTDLPERDLIGLTAFNKVYNNPSVSSWYLDVIEPVGGSNIEFNYTSNSISLSVVSRQQTRYDRISLNDDDPWLFNYFDLSRQVVYNRYLSSIEFENGKIKFLTNTRDDIEGRFNTNLPQRLEYIQIYNKNNVLLKEFGLDQDYFTGIGSTSTNPYAGLRLKLNAITEYGKSGYPLIKSSPYIFTYYNSDGLPSKYSRKMDSWGYYNPTISTVYIDGETYPTQLPQVDQNGRTFTGVVRAPDQTGKYSQSGVLESIIYPTKGSTKFIYEPNRRAINPPDTYLVTSTMAYAYSDDQGGKKLSESFILSTTTTVKFSLYTLATYGTPIPNTQIVGYLKDNNGQVLRSFTKSNPSATLSLSSGTYFIEVIPVEPATDYDIELRVYTESLQERDYRISGGNRIKEIKNYDSDGAQISFKKFIYTENGYEGGNATGIEYGFTRQDETRGVYFHEDGGVDVGDVIRHGVWSTSTELYLIRKSAPIFSLGLTSQSGFVGYENVYVLEGGDGSGGLTKYSYYASEISPPINPYYYYIPGIPLYRDPILGKLKSLEFLDSIRNLIERQEYLYTEKERVSIKGLKIFVDRPSPFPGYHFNNDGIKFYDNVSKWYALTSKIVTKDMNGDQVIIEENYDYENPNHLQLTKSQTTSSKGNIHETRIIYPEDIPNKYSLPGGNITDAEYNSILSLKQQNRVVPIQTEIYQNNVLLSRTRTLFQDIGNALIVPKQVQMSKGPGNLKTRVKYHKYDSYGNMQEVSKINGPHIVYIWGYNGQYPIAKIENVSSYGSISPNLIAAAINASNSDYSETQENNLRLALEALRNSLPNALVTTITYDPLSGITSVTDTNNMKISYTYDNFNRLKFIKDETNKLLQEFKYNYKE